MSWLWKRKNKKKLTKKKRVFYLNSIILRTLMKMLRKLRLKKKLIIIWSLIKHQDKIKKLTSFKLAQNQIKKVSTFMKKTNRKMKKMERNKPWNRSKLMRDSYSLHWSEHFSSFLLPEKLYTFSKGIRCGSIKFIQFFMFTTWETNILCQ